MIASLVLPSRLRERLCEEARLAFPRECCGLVEGARDGAVVRATALHRTENLAVAPDRFEIDPARHFALLRRLRGTGQAIVGCYHSHPNGISEPSARDVECAAEEGFLWLIAAFDGEREPRIAAFVSSGVSLMPVKLEA